MKVVAIIQARMGSSRLPGKSLAKVYKKYSLLEMVLLRVLRAENPDVVILATSEESNCDPLEEISSRLGILTVRGSETDVLSRFESAIKQVQSDIVVTQLIILLNVDCRTAWDVRLSDQICC